MPTKPWVTFRRPDPDREYLALLSELPLKRFRDLGAFLRYTWRIQGQLRQTPGFLGYCLEDEPQLALVRAHGRLQAG